ncbi:MAG: 16S rRNA (cytosine(1402)-N(4))-methyltransferase RsmH [Anaerolineales bacterium]|nr:MAG: 16S rRNA (cytosine(1402)-N(4))-methyltransferase RsmH [Anaerolineales bacterium]
MGGTGHLAPAPFLLRSPVPSTGVTQTAKTRSIHVPVLRQAVLDGLSVQPSGRYVDSTLGGGGHAAAILEASAPDGRLLGLDRDPQAVDLARERLGSYGERAELVLSSFNSLAEVARERGFVLADGVLFDLGLSSPQLADASRGFSFLANGPLDMRFDPNSDSPSAAELIDELSFEELRSLLWEYGEETQARRLAEAIVEARPLETTAQLVEVIGGVVKRRGRIHPATRTFQALRIAVNDELATIAEALPQAVEVLAPGGRLAVISFHSLEDRIVKRFLRQESRDCICPPRMPACTCDHQATMRLLTRKPIRPDEKEVEENSRARSARLRVAERIGNRD